MTLQHYCVWDGDRLLCRITAVDVAQARVAALLLFPAFLFLRISLDTEPKETKQ